MTKGCGPVLLVEILLASVVMQVSAFVRSPLSLSRNRFDATATGPFPSSNNDGTVCAIAGRRPRTVAFCAAVGMSPSPSGDAPKASSDSGGGGGGGRYRGLPSADGAKAPAAAGAVAAPTVPTYRRLYDSAMQLLESELKLEPYPIPAGLEGNSAVVGKGRNQQTVETSITAFRSGKFRQIRAALVETDGPTQVLNFVMFPHPRYDLPIFGADLVSLPGVHLVCIDLQPAHPSQELGEMADARLREARSRHLDGLPWGGDLPEAARKFFSPHCLWAKLGANEGAVEQRARNAVLDYLREYLRLVGQAEPLEGGRAVREIAAGHTDYSTYRRENDPARGMLTRFYGADWTESTIEGILFDFKGL